MKVRAWSATGPDGICPLFLKLPFLLGAEPCQQLLLHALELLFGVIWSTGVVPHQWKQAHVTPVPKTRHPSHVVTFYRPISVTSIVSRVMERVLASRLTYHARKHRWIPRHQFAFRPYRSTAQLLTALTERLWCAFTEGAAVAAVGLDITKAYDSTWVDGLRFKLHSLGLRGNLLHFLHDFLKHRQFRVVLDGEHSTWRSLADGLPQGSGLSPILFSLFTHDMPHSDSLHFSSQWADDAFKCALSDTIPSAVQRLNHELISLWEWSQKWGVGFSPPKSKAIIFTRKRHTGATPPPVVMNGIVIPYHPHIKHLGLLLDSRLSMVAHINAKVRKCMSMLYFVQRVSAAWRGVSSSIFLTLYRCVVLPSLEYACGVWDCASTTAKLAADKLQRTALEMALGVRHRDIPLELLEVEAGVQPSWLRRARLTLSFILHLLYNRIVDSDNPCLILWNQWCSSYTFTPPSNRGVFARVFALDRRWHVLSWFRLVAPRDDCDPPWMSGVPAPSESKCVVHTAPLPSLLVCVSRVTDIAHQCWNTSFTHSPHSDRYRRIHPDVSFWPHCLRGTARLCSIATLLRVAFSDLAHHRWLHRGGASPECLFCVNATESTAHYLLECPAWSSQRVVCFSSLFDRLGIPLSVRVLLGGCHDHNELPTSDRVCIARSLHRFLGATARL